MTCPSCRGEDWCGGTIETDRDHVAHFLPTHRSGWLERHATIHARACRACGFVWLGVDPDRLGRIAGE